MNYVYRNQEIYWSIVSMIEINGINWYGESLILKHVLILYVNKKFDQTKNNNNNKIRAKFYINIKIL